MIIAENISVKRNGKSILKDISFVLPEGKSMAVTGTSGSGKTTLGRLICGLIPVTSGHLEIANNKLCLLVEQQDNFMAASHMRSGYYGQRFENMGLEEVPTVVAYLQTISQSFMTEINLPDIDKSLSQMGMLSLSDRKIMYLSSGERKRLQLSAALLQNPDLLVLDQPFVGLDVSARKKLVELLFRLHEMGKTLVLICDSEHIPAQIDVVLELGKEIVSEIVPFKKYVPEKFEESKIKNLVDLFNFVYPDRQEQYEFAVKMKNVNVSFNGINILKNINWEVKNGEQWALSGPNGSGKTTLLSLITADNPQGYSNDLVLFDRKRGSGESIWDIKKRIGFISPELHLYFLRGKGIFNTIPGLEKNREYSGFSISCEDVISSGFQDQIGFSDSSGGVYSKTVDAWLSFMQLEYLSGRPFHEASLSEQRLLLLARALVKMPSMLILDEPCQGLDHRQTQRFTEILDAICSKLVTTMIYVTHYQDEIPKFVTRILRLDQGQIIYSGEFCNS